jgi:hypothetical protein
MPSGGSAMKAGAAALQRIEAVPNAVDKPRGTDIVDLFSMSPARWCRALAWSGSICVPDRKETPRHMVQAAVTVPAFLSEVTGLRSLPRIEIRFRAIVTDIAL